MFTKESISIIDKNYFDVIDTGIFILVIRSKNTGHYWAIQSGTEYDSCTILHKHKKEFPYHLHGHAKNLSLALNQIYEHDSYQINKN